MARSNSLSLDARQRAMLRAMGVVVWLPQPETAAPAVAAPAPGALRAPQTAPPAAQPAPARPHAHIAPHIPQRIPSDTAPIHWSLHAAQAVYPAAHDAALQSGGWLILLQRPASVLPAATLPASGAAHTALQGQSAHLLDNMLRALHLHQHPRVFSATCTSGNTAESGQPASLLHDSVASLLVELRPACILVLGMALARAVLQQPNAALGQLRGQIHHIARVPAIASHDPAYLLRAQASAKAAAWADLCRARAFFD